MDLRRRKTAVPLKILPLPAGRGRNWALILSRRSLWAEGCYAPVLVLGGNGAKSDEELLLSVKGAMDAGAKGVIMGRNIYRRENVAGICEAVAAVIHGQAAVEEALRLI